MVNLLIININFNCRVHSLQIKNTINDQELTMYSNLRFRNTHDDTRANIKIELLSSTIVNNLKIAKYKSEMYIGITRTRGHDLTSGPRVPIDLSGVRIQSLLLTKNILKKNNHVQT